MALDNPLWRSALALYARPGVEHCCLRLQDQGAAINRLLLACWLGQRGVPVDEARWRALNHEWRQTVTEPLRQIRYRVRTLRAQQPALDDSYRALLQAELAAEQVELMQLWHAVQSWPCRPESASEALMLDHLISYCRVTGLSLDEGHLRQLAKEARELSRDSAELSTGQEY